MGLIDNMVLSIHVCFNVLYKLTPCYVHIQCLSCFFNLYAKFNSIAKQVMLQITNNLWMGLLTKMDVLLHDKDVW